MKKRLLEICVTNLDDAIHAASAGADRLELCEVLSIGGLTPALDWAVVAKQELPIPIHILVRPRAGNFIYDKSEKRLILQEIERFLTAGFEGIVIGALNAKIQIDLDFMKICQNLIGTRNSTFHKAVDVFEKPSEQVKRIQEIGFDTILSSGGKSNVLEGLEELKKMKNVANKKIEIMPGGGLRSANIESIFIQLNPSAFHSAARTEAGLFDATEVRKMAQFLNSITITTT